jgi:cobalt transporter subunit CbtB
MTNKSTSIQSKASAVNSTRLGAAIAALAFGAFLVFGVGFAHSGTLHNAAHDARHAFAFPCH